MRYILIALLLIANLGFAQNRKINTEKFEKNIQSSIHKAYAATVLIRNFDTLSKKAADGMFSGVVIDAAGYVLSAAHAVKPGNYYQINFPDGKKLIAKGLGRIIPIDGAMLKIIDKGIWPYAEMGYSKSLKLFTPCVSIAYPGDLQQSKPTVRFGYVADTHAKSGFFTSTCLMEPGDSGGPVFDILGRVIGIHSSIEIPLDKNFEVPVDSYRKYWDALTVAKTYTYLPDTIAVPADPLANKLEVNPEFASLSQSFVKEEEKLDQYCYTIKSEINGKEISVLGTLIDMNSTKYKKSLNSKSYLVSKSSMIGDSAFLVIKENEAISINVVSRNEENDLVLCEVNRRLRNGLPIDNSRDSLDFNQLGKFLISPIPGNSDQISVLGNQRATIKEVLNPSFIGVTATLKDGKVVLTDVQKSSPANTSGLKIGDQLASINGISITEPVILTSEIQKHKPDEMVQVKLSRDGKEFSYDIILKSRLNSVRHIADQFPDGKNDRRFGFKNVFVHDGKIKPSECGGPVFDRNGDFYGINIARFSRTCTIALPAIVIFKFINSFIQDKYSS